MTKAACFALPFVAATAFAQSKPGNLQVSGYLDVYYEHNFAHSGHGETLNGRLFDIENDSPKISFAELDLSQTVTPKFSWVLQLFAGRAPEILHLAEPGGKNRYKMVRQAYVTFQASKATIDFGKFDTWVGYEAIDTRYQDQYSRSFNTTFSEPGYETGFRVSFKPTAKLSASVYLVQGWGEVEDANDSKSWGVTLNYQADPKTNVFLQNHDGKEGSDQPNDVGLFGGIGFANPGTSQVHLINFLVLRQESSTLKTSLSVDLGRSDDVSNKGDWNGQAIYARKQISTNRAASLRFDRFEDKDGLRAGLPIKLYSITAGYDYTLSPNFMLRVEGRRDMADQAFYIGRGANVDKNRTTFTVAGIAKF